MYINMNKMQKLINFLDCDLQEQLDSKSRKGSFSMEISQCCSMWISKWEAANVFNELWHIYWNAQRGASVIFRETEYKLNPSRVLLIPSHTSYARRLTCSVPHFFIDFKIGCPFKNLERKIYSFSSAFLRKSLEDFLSCDNPVYKSAVLNKIVWHYLSGLDQKDFLEETSEFDFRIAKAVNFMENNLAFQFSIEKLARHVGMSLNNFYILFKHETGQTPKQFWSDLRWRHVGYMLMKTDASIEEIAEKNGFTDRYHFSSCFKKRTGVPPVRYRKIELEKT